MRGRRSVRRRVVGERAPAIRHRRINRESDARDERGVGRPYRLGARVGQAAPETLSLPLRSVRPMQLHGERPYEHRFVCEWCDREFPRAHRRGRFPHYCGRTCRQRAYESRRRGAYVLGLPRAPLPRPPLTRARRVSYETGKNGMTRHALRPDGAPDENGLRPTLCGTRGWVTTVGFEPWLGVPGGHRACLTCWAITERYPAAAPLDVSNDLARARHVLRRLRACVTTNPEPGAMRAAVADALAIADGALPFPDPRDYRAPHRRRARDSPRDVIPREGAVG